jgi:hypothetical protein
MGVISSSKTQSDGAAEEAPLLTSVERPSGIVRMLVILLYCLPILLIVAALVPLNFEFVPYKVAHGWEGIRVPVALGGASLLVVEGVMYLLSR